MSSSPSESTLTAFLGFERIAAGPRAEVIALLRARGDETLPFVFDDSTGDRLDVDLRKHATDVSEDASREDHATRSVGRPRLGVVAREVTLLPRHWDWLARQPGGASVALRKLIDEARHVRADRDAQRAAREAAYRFMVAIAGDLPGFEEATRALFAGDRARFDEFVAPWPEDVRTHSHKLAAAAWSGQ
ncbi:MAG: DUF2239 family protein [Variovorax sp.]|nr:MAG: DUF2239 family protein [Variovorax sp.]